jgi:hypothetical protein
MKSKSRALTRAGSQGPPTTRPDNQARQPKVAGTGL